jgi:small conductance mechanosensitive channel
VGFIASNGIRALVLAAIWIAVIVGVHLALRFVVKRYEKRLVERDGRMAARGRTRFSVLPRATIVLLVLIAAWSVLSIFPATSGAAKAFLASSAALALILGLALTTPLGNLGSGILLVLTQPARLGDRITVDMDRGQTHTGTVERITLAYTTLVTDEGRKIFVPNLTMVKNVIINHSRGDRRRAVSMRLPVAIDAAIDDACRVALESARAVEEDVHQKLELHVHVTEVTETAIWLEIAGFVPAKADVAGIATEIRKRALAGLAEKGLLPAHGQVAEHARFEE